MAEFSTTLTNEDIATSKTEGGTGRYAFKKMFGIKDNENELPTVLGYTWGVKITKSKERPPLLVDAIEIENYPCDLYALLFNRDTYYEYVGCATMKKLMQGGRSNFFHAIVYRVDNDKLLRMRPDWATMWWDAYNTFGPSGGWVIKDPTSGVVIAKALDVV